MYSPMAIHTMGDAEAVAVLTTQGKLVAMKVPPAGIPAAANPTELLASVHTLVAGNEAAYAVTAEPGTTERVVYRIDTANSLSVLGRYHTDHTPGERP